MLLLRAKALKTFSPLRPERQFPPRQSSSRVEVFPMNSTRDSKQPVPSLLCRKSSRTICWEQRAFRKMASAEASFRWLLASPSHSSRYCGSMIISSSFLSSLVILLRASSTTVTSALMEVASSARARSVIRFPLMYIFSMFLEFFSPAARAMMYRSPRLQSEMLRMLASPLDLTSPKHRGSTFRASAFSSKEMVGLSSLVSLLGVMLLRSRLRRVRSRDLYWLQNFRGASFPMQVGKAYKYFRLPSSLGSNSSAMFYSRFLSAISSNMVCLKETSTLEMQLWTMIDCRFSLALQSVSRGYRMRWREGLRAKAILDSRQELSRVIEGSRVGFLFIYDIEELGQQEYWALSRCQTEIRNHATNSKLSQIFYSRPFYGEAITSQNCLIRQLRASKALQTIIEHMIMQVL